MYYPISSHSTYSIKPHVKSTGSQKYHYDVQPFLNISISCRFDGVTAESDSKKEIECKTLAKGPDPSLRKGPNDDLLL